MTEKEIRQIFIFFDKDGNDYLSKGEFISAVDLLKDERGFGISSAYFDDYDFNSDDRISFEEFKNFMQGL